MHIQFERYINHYHEITILLLWCVWCNSPANTRKDSVKRSTKKLYCLPLIWNWKKDIKKRGTTMITLARWRLMQNAGAISTPLFNVHSLFHIRAKCEKKKTASVILTCWLTRIINCNSYRKSYIAEVYGNSEAVCNYCRWNSTISFHFDLAHWSLFEDLFVSLVWLTLL